MKIAPSFLYTLENATLIIIRCCDEEVAQTDLAVSALMIRCELVILFRLQHTCMRTCIALLAC